MQNKQGNRLQMIKMISMCNFLVNLLLNILIDALLFIIYCGCLTIGFWYVSIFFGYLYFNYSLDVDRALICFVSFFVLATFMPRKRTLHTFVITLYVYSLLLPTLVWFAVGVQPHYISGDSCCFFRFAFFTSYKNPAFGCYRITTFTSCRCDSCCLALH